MAGVPVMDAPVIADALFNGPGEVRALARAVDWADTPLGPPDRWPAVLRSAVRTVLEAPVALCLSCGPDLTLIYNDAYRGILGAKHPAALGRPIAAVWAEIWPTLAPQLAQIRDGGPPILAEDAPFVVDRGNGHGREAWFSYAFSALRDDDGTWLAVLNVVMESTERVRMGRAIGRLLDVSPAVMGVLSGPEHVISYVNPTWDRVVGKPGALGRPFREVFPELADTGLFDRMDRVYATGEPYTVAALRVPLQRRPGGPVEDTFWNFVWQPQTPLRGSHGALLGGAPGGPEADETLDILVHAIDVTAQVRGRREAEAARDEAERARADAEAAGRLKSEFLATMSHEFRTPLNAILGYAQLLDMGVLGATTPAQHAHLERLQASARHLLQLVDDVLDVAKVDAHRMQVRRDTLATGAAVAAGLALVQPQATAKGIRIEDLGVSGAGVPYVGDEHRVRQIVVNVLANAVKFTPPGGVITVSCGAAPEPDPGVHPGGAAGPGAAPGSELARGYAFIRIQDTGPGVAPSLQARLFEPFMQGDGALTRAHGGTGLGLAISRRLARLMGGDLVLDGGRGPGEPRSGASFTLWLPAPNGAVDEPQPATPRRRTPTSVAAVSAYGEPTEAGLDAGAFAVLHALGARLAADAQTVADRYAAALRADERFPGVRELPAVQLRDHTAPLVGLIAAQLMVIGETRGAASELLGDGVQLQRVVSELHGAQRHRLGWAEADIERETVILRAEVERALEGALREAGTPQADAPAVDRPSIDAAARYAADVSRHVLEQSRHTALRAYRFAQAAATP